ncbi:MAG: type II secretion system F family protein [Lentisphaeria bacterium]|nr:type II secretion system F family protein [Lentisphaeria bacterium]
MTFQIILAQESQPILAGPILWLGALLGAMSISCFVFYIMRFITSMKLEKKTYQVQVPLVFKLTYPIAKNFESRFQTDNWAKTRNETERQLKMAGLVKLYTPSEFIALRFTSGVLLSLIAIGCFIIPIQLGTPIGFLFLGMGLFFPNLWLRGIIKTRHRSIQRSLPNVLDLLTLSVEAGRDFLSALADILHNRPNDPLGDELNQVFREIQLGKQRREALRALGKRVNQDDLNTVVETLVQADELGASIGYILRILGDQMRQKRFAYAEKMANEAPTKLLLPLFLFIFPAVMMIILGPVLIKYSGFLTGG